MHIKQSRSVSSFHFLNIGLQSIFCIFSMSCSWAGLPRATGYSSKYMNHFLPLDWTSFVPKTMCECSRSKDGFGCSKNFFRNKAVSDGAISFYLDHFVKTRVSKVTYGHFCNLLYDPSVPDHRSQSHNVFTSVSGAERIKGFFDIILPKVNSLIFSNPCH